MRLSKKRGVKTREDVVNIAINNKAYSGELLRVLR
jgi:hypothetical protein